MWRFIIVSLWCIFQMANSACWRKPVKVDITAYGRRRAYCEYQGSENQMPQQFMPGSVFETLNCEKCTCYKDEMECCGVGYFAGKVSGPDGCEVVLDGCDAILVLKGDNKTDCFNGKPIDQNNFEGNTGGLFAPFGKSLLSGRFLEMPRFLPPPPPPKKKPMFVYPASEKKGPEPIVMHAGGLPPPYDVMTEREVVASFGVPRRQRK